MIGYTNRQLSDLENKIRSITEDYDNTLKRSELSFKACKETIAKVKEFIIKYKFKNAIEEIKFFKENKPLFNSKLIYHLSLYNIETKKPNGGKEILKKYLIKELEKLKSYFDYNLDFYKYHRAGANYLDHKYFTRDTYDIQLTLDGYIFENDTRFSTSHPDLKPVKLCRNTKLFYFLNIPSLFIQKVFINLG